MIDLAARAKLRTNQGTQAMMEATKNAIVEGMKAKGPEDTLRMVFEKKDDQEVVSLLTKIGAALPIIRNSIPKQFVLPKVFQVKGSVTVANPITVNNLLGIEKKLEDMSTQIKMLAHAISSVPQQKIEFPKIDIPKGEKIDFTPIIEAIENQDKGSKKDDSIPVLRKIQNAIEELVNRPVMTPQPVTNVNINALQGYVKTTATTVGTTVTPLPGYGRLFNRRALQIYNNSSNTIYYGGSDVTTSNGIPVTASSFSNVIDAGYNMIVYGIASTSNNDIRVIEVSKDTTANVQE